MDPKENSNPSSTVGTVSAGNFAASEPQNTPAQPIFFSSTTQSKTSAPIMGQPAVSSASAALEQAAPTPVPEPAPEPVTPVAPAPQPAPVSAPKPIQPPAQPQPTLADLAAEAAYAEELKTAPDIVLAQDKKPMNKKLIIGVIAAVIAAAVAGLVILLISQTVGKPSIAAVRDSYNAYANYLLTGSETTPYTNIPEDVGSDNYAISAQFTSHNLNYVNTAKELFDDFYKKYESARSSLSDYTTSAIDAYAVTVESFNNIVKTSAMDDDALMADFLADGKESALSSVESSLDQITDEEYAMEFRDYVSNYLEALALYNSTNCITGTEIDYRCAANSNINARADEHITNALNAKDNIRTIEASLMGHLIEDTRNIAKMFTSETGAKK